MAIVKLILITLAATIYFTSAFRAELPADDLEDDGKAATARNGEASAMHWSSPAESRADARMTTVQMGLKGSMGVRQSDDTLLYSTAVRKEAVKGYQQGYVLGYRTNATIDHYRWVYVGEDGYTAEFQVMSGGLGYKNIALYLKSQDDHGIFYNISIYGRFEDQLRVL